MKEKLIYGLIGYPVKHSLSKAMQEAAFKRCGMDAEYRLFEVEPQGLEDFLLKDIQVKDIDGNSVWTQELSGFNITIPHKVKAREILEKKFPFNKDTYMMQRDLYYVKLSGAINTVKRKEGSLKYWNTDSSGFLQALESDLRFGTKNKNVLLIGCGGAGRAIIAALSWNQMQIKKIYIYDTSSEAINSARGHFSEFAHLKEKLEFISKSDIPAIIEKCDLLVNGSSVGMKENDLSVIDKSLLTRNKKLSVYDVVYNRQTQLIKDAKDLGLSTCGGLNMLLYQGVIAFELWTGKRAPIPEMKKALLEALNANAR